ncbi:MAG: hypothetical protein ABEI99_01225 [Halobaculum sp.]
MTTDDPPDVPPDVASVLGQLLDAAESSAESLDTDEFEATVETAQTVARNKLPESDLRARLLHGTERVLATGDHEPGVAAEYVRGMRRLLAEATGEHDDDRDDPAE